MKDNQTSTPTRSLRSAASLTSLSVDISPSSSNFIEVLYIGKIKVWHKKVPETFIDDALEKFKAHDLERRSSIDAINSGAPLIRRRSVGSSGLINANDPRYSHLIRSTTLSTITVKTPDVDGKPLMGQAQPAEEEQATAPPTLSDEHADPNSSHESQDEVGDNVSPTSMSRIKRVKFKTRSLSESNSNGTDDAAGTEVKQNITYSSDSETSDKTSKGSISPDDHNRTMVLQVGRVDLRLISPDRKVVLLHKQNRDIRTCTQGIVNSSHFGFICQEGTTLNTYIGYVFKCESQAVASEAVGAITQSFSNTSQHHVSKAIVTSCEHCPMVWYHRLCSEVEHLTDRKTQAAIFRRCPSKSKFRNSWLVRLIDQLDEEEQSIILTKFRGAETDSLREQNEFLMMLLRAHCEMKQGRHIHDTAENRSEFLNQYLGGSTIFTKAKRTLTNSFDNLLKRKASKDDINSALSLNLGYRESSPNSQSSSFAGDLSDRESDGFRSRSSTVGSLSDAKESRSVARENSVKSSSSPDKSLKSPMMDIFLKVGSTPRTAETQKPDAGSWRQAIFKQVVESNKAEDAIIQKRSKEDLRMLWKKSIHQAILLIRMEKENAKIRAQQEENAVKRIKLEYDEMKSSNRDVVEVWDLLTSKDSRVSLKIDNKLLLQAIHQGIPRSKRGEVWFLLAEQHCKSCAPTDTTLFPNYNVPYENLLKQLTSHQHAILIDLGRTFPSHSYFSSSLGPGQLALFNLLKAYSLLDPEVGYCQGLSFVAGVLLLHMEESQAFYLLRHLMFRRGLRKQYLPDMVALQVKLYQLSRLVHDMLPVLYEHFDFHEVSPTLYAAPWLLTVFASQFPLGFVTRVFDVLFLDNTDVVFKVAIALLSLHKEALLKCDSFEEIMNYLKIQLPAMDKDMLEKVMKEVSTSDIARQLNEYQVEYQVLQEEMISVQPQVEALHKLEGENKILRIKSKTLGAQLELVQSNLLRLEKNRTLQQANINRLGNA